MDAILGREFLGTRVQDYIGFLALLLAGWAAVWLARSVVVARLKPLARRTATPLDDFALETIESRILPLGWTAVFLLASRLLSPPRWAARSVEVVCLALLTVFGVRLLTALLMDGLEAYWVKREPLEGRRNVLALLLRLARAAIWGVAVVLLLANLGVEISPLLAGLGIGGVAAALAGQALLSDLFSCFAIFFDRPFEVGDFIVAGDCMGVVEYIGIKTTRIRSLGGEQIVCSNHDLTGSRLRNFKRMEQRRVVFRLGVAYGTGVEKLREATRVIEEIIRATEGAVFDRAHFFSYGDWSLVIEVVYYVAGGDYTRYMDIQQEINLRIKEEFEKGGIVFAYPTRTVILSQDRPPA